MTICGSIILEWELFRTKLVQKIKINYLFNVFILKKLFCLWHNGEKYGRDGQATDDNTTHARCILDNLGYKHTLRLCNNYCFSTTKMVKRTRLGITFYMGIAWLVKTTVQTPDIQYFNQQNAVSKIQ